MNYKTVLNETIIFHLVDSCVIWDGFKNSRAQIKRFLVQTFRLRL